MAARVAPFFKCMMTSSNGNIFSVTGHLCGEFTCPRWTPRTKASDQWWRGALMFSLICVWINDWVNNREAGDLRRYRAHYDVIVMLIFFTVRCTAPNCAVCVRDTATTCMTCNQGYRPVNGVCQGTILTLIRQTHQTCNDVWARLWHFLIYFTVAFQWFSNVALEVCCCGPGSAVAECHDMFLECSNVSTVNNLSLRSCQTFAGAFVVRLVYFSKIPLWLRCSFTKFRLNVI